VRARIGAPDLNVTPAARMSVVSELMDRLGVDRGVVYARIEPIKTRDRGHTSTQMLVGMPAVCAAPLTDPRREWVGRTRATSSTPGAACQADWPRQRPGPWASLARCAAASLSVF